MRTYGASAFKRFIGALAIFGALLNVWVITVHIRSVLLMELGARGDGVVICRQGGTLDRAVPDQSDKKSAPDKQCAICSGLASLHLAVMSPPSVLAAPCPDDLEVWAVHAALVADHRPRQTLNRGPPLLS
jgi:Protein of unknown function (DUF2946)